MARKIFSILLTLLLVVSLFPPRASSQGYKGNISVTPVRLEQLGDSLYVDLEVYLSAVKVRPELDIEYIPRLLSNQWSTELPSITVKGRSNWKAYERSLTMEGSTPETEASGNPCVVMKGYGKGNEIVTYKYTTRYESWMADAKLDLIRNDKGCGKSYLVDITRLADSITKEILPERPVFPLLAFVSPEAEVVKNREIQAECKLDYIVNKTDIDPAYMNNPYELSRIRGIIDELRNDPHIDIVGLEIIGYASPEGSLESNKKLSEGRAMSLRNYLASLYDFPAAIYSVSFGGENWAGLVKALDTLNIDNKDEILNIIHNTSIEDGREGKLMQLDGGNPYRFMLKNVFPSLRTAICKIDYHIKGFEAHDAAEVFRTSPQNLSLNELYMVANSMEKGSEDFIDVFETAVRMYPADRIANLNAAVAALSNENIQAAERYINKIGPGPQGYEAEYYNSLGILAWLKEDIQAAKKYFGDAAAAGLEEAKINLNELIRKTEM